MADADIPLMERADHIPPESIPTQRVISMRLDEEKELPPLPPQKRSNTILSDTSSEDGRLTGSAQSARVDEHRYRTYIVHEYHPSCMPFYICPSTAKTDSQ